MHYLAIPASAWRLGRHRQSIKKTKKKRVKNAMTCSIPRRGYAVPILRLVSSERFALSASVVSDHTEEAFTSCYELNSTRLNRESRTQVSSTSISASLIHTIINKQYHFMTSSDRSVSGTRQIGCKIEFN